MTSFDDKGASNNTWYVGAIFVLPIMLVAKCVHAYCANGQHRLWMTKVQATTDGMWVLSLRCTQQSPIERADYNVCCRYLFCHFSCLARAVPLHQVPWDPPMQSCAFEGIVLVASSPLQ